MFGIIKKRYDAVANANSYFMLFVIACVALAVFIFQNKERNSLLQQLDQTRKQNEELNAQFNDMANSVKPLKNEVGNLRRMLLIEKTVEKTDSSDELVWPRPKPEESMNSASGYPSATAGLKTTDATVSLKSAGTEGRLSSLRGYLKGIEKDNNLLREKIDQLNAAIASKEEDIARLDKDNFGLKDDLGKANQGQGQLKAELESLKEKIDQLNSVVTAKEESLVQLNKDNSGLKEDLDKANQELSQLRAESDREINGLKTQLAQKETEATGFNAVKANLDTQLNEFNNKIINLTNANSLLESQLLQKEKDRTALAEDLKSLREELSRQADNDAALQKKITELTGALTNKEQERNNTVQELAQLRESKSGAEAEIRELKIAKAADETQINQLTMRINELKAAGDALNNSISLLPNMLNQKESEIKTQLQEISSLKDEISRMAREKDSLTSVLKERDSAISQLQAEMRSVQEAEKKKADELSRLVTINTGLKGKLSDIYKELEMMRLEKKPERTKVDALLDKVGSTLNGGEGSEGISDLSPSPSD